MEALTELQITEKLESISGWSYKSDTIQKKFELSDFKEALGFIVRVGLEAELLGHHPNLANVYNQVTISLQTHDVGNKVTEKDFELATRIEAI
ncbi:MAG: 4a-hydroxytetrahydrobiopterin dehydratase [Balneola sp.]|nr:MAG: 4a-hydroxytetrahydrobiopterin dehydratase [Balneola sp.]